MDFSRRSVSLEAILARASGFGDLTSSTMDLLNKAVHSMKIDTTAGPPIYIENPFQHEAAPGAGSALARLMKPKVTLEMASGWGDDQVFAPYGDPGTSIWPLVLGAIAVGVALSLYGGVKVVQRRKRR